MPAAATSTTPAAVPAGSDVAPLRNGMPKSAAAAHIRQLTGIRAVAALWVLTFHFRLYLLGAFGFLYPVVPLFNVGYLGVDLFFALSGFILTYTHIDRMIDGWGPKKMVGFLWLRLSRIWPVLFVMLLVWACYNAALLLRNNDGRLQGALDPERFLAHVFLVHAWTTAHHDWNPVDWSLSAEWLAYLVFTVFVVLLGKLRSAVSSKALMMLSFISVLPTVLIGMGFQDGSDLLWNGDTIVAGIVPLRVLTEFIGGALIALLVQRHGLFVRLPWFLRPTTVIVVIVALLYLIQRFDFARRLRFGVDWRIYGHLMWGSTETVAVVPLFLLLIGSLAVSQRDPATRFFSTRVLVWGGKVSFSLYMVHWLFLDIIRRIIIRLHIVGIPTSLTYRIIVLLGIAGAVLAGYLLHRFVEEPCRRAMRKMLPRSMQV